MNRNSYLDSIKGLAIIGIVAIHFNTWYSLLAGNGLFRSIVCHGDYGVELTYIVNSFLFAKNYDKSIRNGNRKASYLILKQFARIAPLYYLFMTLNFILKIIFESNISVTFGDVLSHYLFINIFNYKWFNSFFGGSGYIGVLALMWFFYPVFLKHIDTLEKAIVCTMLTLLFTYCAYIQVIYFCFPDNKELWLTGFLYIIRGISSFAVGNLLYHLLNKKALVFSSKTVWMITIISICFLIATIRCGKMNTFFFLLFSLIIIFFNYNKPIFLMDNFLLAFCGKYVFEIFLVHIFLSYVLKYVHISTFTEFCINAILTIPVAICTQKFIGKPINKLISKLLNRLV